MSKNRKISRKRFIKLVATATETQVQKTRDYVRRAFIAPMLRAQDKINYAKHQRKKTGAEDVHNGKH